jgi:hypothetical protein
VFLDESGKTGDFLIVAALWAVVAYQELLVSRELKAWLDATEWKELHFVEISSFNQAKYLDLLAFLKERLGTFGFKFIAVERSGAGSTAFEKMFYHLTAEGISHEDRTGRSPLPRTLTVWKDLENKSADALLLADMRDRLGSRFGNKLEFGPMQPVTSTDNTLLQVCDLFLGSVNRHLNGTATTGDHPKDKFARRMLQMLSVDPFAASTVEDVSYRLHV